MSPGNATATHITASDIIGYYYRQCILDQFLHRQSSIITIHVRYHVAHQIVSDFNLHRVLTASPARKMFCDDNCLETPWNDRNLAIRLKTPGPLAYANSCRECRPHVQRIWCWQLRNQAGWPWRCSATASLLDASCEMAAAYFARRNTSTHAQTWGRGWMTKASGVGERRKGRRIFSVSREMSVAFPLQTLWCHGEISRCAFSMARHG